MISESLKKDEGERKDAIKKGNAIFAFTLKNTQGNTESWYIDLKEKGEVGKGTAPQGKKADGKSVFNFFFFFLFFRSSVSIGSPSIVAFVANSSPHAGQYREANMSHRSVILHLSDQDFQNLVGGKASAQKLFMSGKLKVKGGVMKATKAEPILKKAQPKAKL